MMKKLYTFFALMLAVAGVQAQDSVTVIFAVDASGITVDAAGISVAGNWQDNYAGSSCGEWSAGCTFLADADSDGVHTVRVRLLKGSYQYKYINGANWGPNEGVAGTKLTDSCSVNDGSGNINRVLDLTNVTTDADYIVGPYLYDDCTISSVRITSIDRAFSNSLAMSVSPNPADNAVELSFRNPASMPFEMTMTSMTGAVVRRESVSGSSVTIERGELAAGLYFVTLRNAAGQQASQKVMFR